MPYRSLSITNPEDTTRVIFWSKLYRATLLILVIFMSIAVLAVARKVFTVANQLVEINQQEKTSITEGRQSRDTQVKATQGYIKCLVLLKYDRPDLTPSSSRTDVSNALDKCSGNAN